MSEHSDSKKGLVIFLRVLVVFVVLALIFIFALIFFGLMNKTSKKAEDEKEPIDNLIASSTNATADEAEEEEPVANGDAAGVEQETWMTGLKIYNPSPTESTIHLPQADMSSFQAIIEASAEENAAAAEDEEGGSAWDSVTLTLNSVEGSINYSTPGDPVKTQELVSTYMILVDVDNDSIVAERGYETVISPASMTKILTVVTARDFIDETTLDDTFTITQEIADYWSDNDCSAVGFLPGDEVTVRDLLYGTILPSGADAAMGLAEYCCGSEEKFVEEMNRKAAELGLSENAHFTNPVGVYNEDLHCTVKDIAIVLGVAVQDDLLRDVLSARTYTTSTTYEELDMPDGIPVSNWFLRRIEDKEMDGDVIAAKTGFVKQSGCCAASYYEADNGKRYICVTANSFSSWRAIYDHVAIYRSLTD